ncbi:shikimate kinase [Phaeovulum vinaykumarii]|uniref:Shikimate kinase n=2 Tax=Phaeovulum vinaykumarii TaxID=407234 RepID=A0A1N7LMH1_9RHOB|nr:shikimate kinase [Phaeovulum vinaykumarii]SOC05442.1 shikimate kinase [Phaeovulum vinaykumarii]
MGAGKTAVGAELSRRLGVAFLDSDAQIERAANATIAEIFARDGEAFFRARETEVIARLMAAGPAVISTGGGAFLSEVNRATIAASGVSVWLKADLEILWNRVRHKTTRPLLRTADPRATLAGLLAQREPLYGLAQVIVEAEPDLSIEGMALKVIEALRARGGVLAAEGE